MSSPEIAIEVVGCLIEIVCDEQGNISPKDFDKIFNACLKSILIAGQVADKAVDAFRALAAQVWIASFLKRRQMISHDFVLNHDSFNSLHRKKFFEISKKLC
jgi:hypothetical protein